MELWPLGWNGLQGGGKAVNKYSATRGSLLGLLLPPETDWLRDQCNLMEQLYHVFVIRAQWVVEGSTEKLCNVICLPEHPTVCVWVSHRATWVMTVAKLVGPYSWTLRRLWKYASSTPSIPTQFGFSWFEFCRRRTQLVNKQNIWSEHLDICDLCQFISATTRVSAHGFSHLSWFQPLFWSLLLPNTHYSALRCCQLTVKVKNTVSSWKTQGQFRSKLSLI